MIRAHHLGLLFAIFADSNFATKESKRFFIEEGIRLFCDNNSKYHVSSVTQKICYFLTDFFFNPKSFICVVAGLDDICNAGCQKYAKDSKEWLEGCANPKVKSDLFALSLFNFRIQKVYARKEILSAMKESWERYRYPYNWSALLYNYEHGFKTPEKNEITAMDIYLNSY